MLKRIVRIFGGDPNKREIDKYSELVDQINALEPQFDALSSEALAAKTDEFRSRLAAGETLDDLLPEAYATVREASKRTLGLRHYDVQLIGGAAMHHGKVVEMRTGEGKTLVATLPLYLNALTGKGTHLVTVNDYLARRDARWMAPIYSLLGLSVGVLQMASRTENGKNAFLVDLGAESPHEDQHQLRMVPRTDAYAADITYGTNSEFGFDYLRDNMTKVLEDRVQRGHYFAIIDEVDNILIDEARTPLIISGPAHDESEWYIRMAQVAKNLRPEDYEIEERNRMVTLTEIGEAHVEQLLDMPLRDPERPEDITLEQARILGYLEQALRAQFLFKRNKDYLVQGGKVVIIDEFTGRLMPGRRWSDGLHQAVEAKEGVKVQSESVTYATITIQNYFRMYEKLSGMTGTAVTEAEEFDEIYKLDVLSIPTNLEYQASRADSGLEVMEDRDEQGYKYVFYARKDDPEKAPVFWKRKDYPDVVYRTGEVKLRAIAQEILKYHALGRPMLVGTTSVELSDRVSGRLRAEPLRRLALVLLLRYAWMEANQREEDGRQIPELQYLNRPLEQLDISQMRKMAREIEISFNPEDDSNIERLLGILDLPASAAERLKADLQAGISHEVLNARKHTEESQIIAGAGAFGAVTIATNMAGRGVDIKLGGELAEEITAAVARVLRRAGYEEPYDMTLEERRQALMKLDPEAYGIYEGEINYFFQYLEDMERVRDLGGLHVIGSERHEARRIDNQLRGRAARQGDPGSSRFYLSMEDDLMRLFGGQQADNLMQRLKIDDALPLEMSLVSRIVEQSQTRVEGANFDVRKHLLEYDDVLNTQRAKIYEQRNRIFKKEDLSDDVIEMLRSEVNRRIPESLVDEEGPWKLLAWIEQIQPPLKINNLIYPSYSLRLLANDVLGIHGKTVKDQPAAISTDAARDGLAAIVRNSIDAEHEHVMKAVSNLLERTQEQLDAQLAERQETLDTFIEGLGLVDETEPRSPVEAANELSALVRTPLRLSPQEQRALVENPEAAADEIWEQVESYLVSQSFTRLIGAIERRVDESLEINPGSLENQDWGNLADQILDAVENVFQKRRERYLDPDSGQVVKDIENALARAEGPVTRNNIMSLLSQLTQGARASFDKKTHRRVWQRTQRFTYVYYAAQLLGNREAEDLVADVLEHLEGAQQAMQRAWGLAELARLANSSVEGLDEPAKSRLKAILALDENSPAVEQPLIHFSDEQKRLIIDELGRQALTAIYRQLILGVITELWIDYLTQMEALRVSIGLEAYGQRDPLVQYKNRAFELFQNLLNDMRTGVVTRMFTYKPRDLNSVQATVSRDGSGNGEASADAGNGKAEVESSAQVEPEKKPEVVKEKPQKAKPERKENVSPSKKRRRSRR